MSHILWMDRRGGMSRFFDLQKSKVGRETMNDLSNLDMHKPARWRDLMRRDLRPFSLVLGGGVIVHAINVFVSTTILPSVVAEIGGLSLYAWSTTFFVAASIVSAALTSRLKTASGPRAAYLIAFALFFVGAVICGASTNFEMLNSG